MRSPLYLLFLAACFLFRFSTLNAQDNDTLLVVIKLGSIDDELTFNQAHVFTNALEYKWSVTVDTDNDPATGNGAGYDVELTLAHFKPPGATPFTSDILGGTQHNTFILSGTSGSYGHALQAAYVPEDTSIHLKGLKSWPELAGIDAGDPFHAHAFFRAPEGLLEDQTSPAILPADLTDPAGDAAYSFMDIELVRITEISSSLFWLTEEDLRFDIFPNPVRDFALVDYQLTSGEPSVRFVVRTLEGQTFRVFNVDPAMGRLRIATGDWPAGAYFCQFITRQGMSRARKMMVVK